MKNDIVNILDFLPKFIYEDKSGKPIGLDGRIRVNYFLDLLSSVHVEQNLIKLSNVLIKYLAKLHISKYDGIVGPKNGNTVLAREVSKITRRIFPYCHHKSAKKPCLFVHRQPAFGGQSVGIRALSQVLLREAAPFRLSAPLLSIFLQ